MLQITDKMHISISPYKIMCACVCVCVYSVVSKIIIIICNICNILAAVGYRLKKKCKQSVTSVTIKIC